jgi:alpha-L-rhamnosidase
MGGTYDARLERPGWSAPGLDEGGWSSVRLAAVEARPLVAPAGPPVRRIEDVRAVAVRKTPGGHTVVDFGQNLVGWLRLRARGPAGTTVKLRHAEVLDEDGNFCTADLRLAKQLVTCTLKGGA